MGFDRIFWTQEGHKSLPGLLGFLSFIKRKGVLLGYSLLPQHLSFMPHSLTPTVVEYSATVENVSIGIEQNYCKLWTE